MNDIRAARGRNDSRRWGMWAVIALLLLLPLVAMAFTPEINWTRTDFAAAGGLLVGAGLAYEWVVTRIVDPRGRAAATVALLAALLLAWAHGAVGVF